METHDQVLNDVRNNLSKEWWRSLKTAGFIGVTLLHGVPKDILFGSIYGFIGGWLLAEYLYKCYYTNQTLSVFESMK